MIFSMTGYGSSKYSNKGIEIFCEIKTVNHRFLELSLKPNDIDNKIDLFIRNLVSKNIKRGSVDIRFKLKFPSSTTYHVDKLALKNLLRTIKSIDALNSYEINFSDLNDVPGIIRSEQNIKTNKVFIKNVFKKALSNLIKNRSDEGLKIKNIILKKINIIQKNVIKIQKVLKKLSIKRSKSILKKVREISFKIDNDRLEQEVAILALKHDVAEELERISFHLISLKNDISLKKVSGKKIDFILQELFRETNTLSVKLDDPTYKKLGLESKLLVEEMREQIQNVE